MEFCFPPLGQKCDNLWSRFLCVFNCFDIHFLCLGVHKNESENENINLITGLYSQTGFSHPDEKLTEFFSAPSEHCVFISGCEC